MRFVRYSIHQIPCVALPPLVGGDEADSVDFIHISFEMLDGRTSEQKRELSRQLMDVLVAQASHVRSLTVNIRDMDRACFQKVTN